MAGEDFELRNDPFMTHSKAPQQFNRPVSPRRATSPSPAPSATSAPATHQDQPSRAASDVPADLAPPAPREPIIPVWYPAENNWATCNYEMADAYRQINEEFSGQWFNEQRVVAETGAEKLQDALYDKTKGRVGQQYQTKTRNAHVIDIYQDWRFPGENRSWFRGGAPDEFSDMACPKTWQRLMELSLDVPYPHPGAGSGFLTPRAGRIYQGQIEDFYLCAAMQAVGMKPHLIADIFANMQYSNPRLGVFTLRFYKHGMWQFVNIDDSLPFDAGYNPLCSTSEYFPDFSWPSLIEKAYAKMHGSWEALGGGGHVEEVMTDLTGGCSARYGTTDVAADRLWQYLYEMQRCCVFGCNINEAECSKRKVPIEKHWASSIYAVAKWEGIPYVCVCCAAPVATIRHFPSCDVPSPEGYGVHDGFAWLRIDDFTAFFDTIYECRLVNSEIEPPRSMGQIPYTPGYVGGAPWFEEVWAFQGDVYAESAPSFLFEIHHAPVEIVMEVSQTDLRYDQPLTEHESGRGVQAPLLLRFFQCTPSVNEFSGGEIYLVHLSSWGHCRDACTAVKVMKPGKYLAMISIPGRYLCRRMIFRTYSTMPFQTRPITQHRSWVSVNPCEPLNAIPYHLAGFMRVDSYTERLPQMFDEAEGRGKPLANGGQGSLSSYGQRYEQDHLHGWRKSLQDLFGHLPHGQNADGLKVVGKFGGKDAVASTEAKEIQAVNCSVM